MGQEQNQPSSVQVTSNSTSYMTDYNPRTSKPGISVYDTGIATGKAPETYGMYGVVAWKDGKTVSSLDPELKRQVDSIVRGVMSNASLSDSARKDMLNYAVSDVMDDQKLNNSAPRTEPLRYR